MQIPDRLPPADLDAERATLGSMFLAGKEPIFREIVELLTPDDFYLADHGIIFESMREMHAARKPIDTLTVRENLLRRELLDEIGGSNRLADILACVPSWAHGMHYASIVREKSMLRSIIATASQSIRDCYLPANDDRAAQIAQRHVTSLASMVTARGSSKYHTLGQSAIEAYDQIKHGGAEMIQTGFRDLDDAIGGVRVGEMVVIGARPSMGKSTLGRQIALRVAKQKIPVGMISMEESHTKIARNNLSSEAQIDNHRLRKGDLSKEEWGELADALPRLSLPLFICDTAFRLGAVKSAAAMLVSKAGCKLLIIDYLQKIHSEGKDRFEKVTNTSQELSTLFKELNVAGIVLAQIKREVEHRSDQRPTMSDLRESGQIEQDADGIIFLHREDYYRQSEPGYPPTGEAELIIAKWRDAKRGGVVKLKSEMHYQRFDDLGISGEQAAFL